MKATKILDLISDKITGEWGDVSNDADKGVKVLRTTNFRNDGQLSFDDVVIRSISERIVEKKKLQNGDVIIEKSGGSPAQPVGRVVYFIHPDNKVYLCNNFTTILRPSQNVHPKYFFYALYYLYLTGRTLSYQNKTTGIINLQLDRYLSETIPLPDYSKQEQIANILDVTNFLRQKRKQSFQFLDDFLRATFLDMFGDPVKNIKKWVEKNLLDVSDIKGGGTPSKSHPEYFAGDINWVSPKDMKNFYIRETIDKITKEAIDKSSAKLLPAKSVLMVVRSGILKNKLPVAINLQPLAVNQDMKVFIPKKEIVPEFLICWFISQEKNILQTVRGTTADNISSDVIKKLKVIVPPIDLQDKFALIVNKIEQMKEDLKTSLTDMDNQFNALTQRYFG